jgi:hypothetical protein
VIAKLFVPGEESRLGNSRAHAVMARILALDEAEVADLSTIGLAPESSAPVGGPRRRRAGAAAGHSPIGWDPGARTRLV